MNEDCDKLHEMSISTTELYIKTENTKNMPVQSTPSLKVALGNKINVYFYHLIPIVSPEMQQ